jgi:ubiquinone/menaquinone biosynthesis C-methylase UbiE
MKASAAVARNHPMGLYHDRVVPHLINLAMRRQQLVPYRDRIISQAEGRVLEIGIGSGANLPFYRDNTKELLGIEPHPKLLNMAAGKAHRVPTKLMEASAESIPLDRASVDTIVTTWTLCSIPDITKALSEMRRVLKPNGRMLFVEHGLAPDEGIRKWQNRLNPLWKPFTGGCHLNRPIANLIEAAGFRISRLETGYIPGPKPMTFLYEGAADPR